MEGLLNRGLKDDDEAAVERGEPSPVCAERLGMVREKAAVVLEAGDQ